MDCQCAAARLSAIQMACNPCLAFACNPFGSLFKTFAVLCTQHRCVRVVGYNSPSAETLYQYIARDKRAGGTLYRQLRYQGKPYRKKYGRTDYRGRIPGRVDIDQRPAIVAARTRLGDWEADLTSQAITDLLSDFKAVVHTITYDNGREFNGHQAINQALGCDSYFAKP